MPVWGHDSSTARSFGPGAYVPTDDACTSALTPALAAASKTRRLPSTFTACSCSSSREGWMSHARCTTASAPRKIGSRSSRAMSAVTNRTRGSSMPAGRRAIRRSRRPSSPCAARQQARAHVARRAGDDELHDGGAGIGEAASARAVASRFCAAGATGRVRPLVAVVGVAVARARPRAHVPIRPRLPGYGEADVDDALRELGDHVVRAVLVARHDEAGDAVVGDRDAVVAGLGEHRVHPLEHALGDARRLADPRRRREHEDVGLQDPVADGGPLVPVALVGRDPGADVVVDDADGRDVDALGRERLGDHARQALGVGLLGDGFRVQFRNSARIIGAVPRVRLPLSLGVERAPGQLDDAFAAAGRDVEPAVWQNTASATPLAAASSSPEGPPTRPAGRGGWRTCRAPAARPACPSRRPWDT